MRNLSYLYKHNIKIFDYPKFAEPLRNEILSNAEQIAKENNIEIEFVKKSHIRKEDIIKKVLDKRGYHSGIVHIISAMESCGIYRPWHDKISGKTYKYYLTKLGKELIVIAENLKKPVLIPAFNY